MICTRIAKQFGYVLLLAILLVSFTSARKIASKKAPPPQLSSIHIVDRNGLAETISSKDRLAQYEGVDFLKSQPYQKVLRIYTRDAKGDMRSYITTYHANGNIKQYLEVLNGRACGMYHEWYENGNCAVQTKVIGGVADVTPQAEQSWLFDGLSRAWNEDGKLVAEISYYQGSLEGWTLHYHPSGQLWKRIPYVKNEIHGVIEIHKTDGELLQQISYQNGMQQGPSYRYWDRNHLASQEEYVQGRLENGQYYSRDGELLSEVRQGNGFKVMFSKNGVKELQEYQNGLLEGDVKVFSEKGCLIRIYRVKNKIKHGEEINFYEANRPKLSFFWNEGKIQGYVKTWYPNGILESQREMADNARNGIATAWYQDGNLMMVEEYANNNLIRGEYYPKGERIPSSQVIQGKGTATIYDAEGRFMQKISYEGGKPVVGQ